MKTISKPKNILFITFYTPLTVLLDMNSADIDIIRITHNK